MAKTRPSDADRIVSYVIVAAVVGFIGSKVSGLPGAMAGAVVGAVSHYALDASIAQVIAEHRVVPPNVVATFRIVSNACSILALRSWVPQGQVQAPWHQWISR